MSSITTFLTRPATLSILAVCGTGAFLVRLKSKTAIAKKARKGSNGDETDNDAIKSKDYQVSTGRSGGGV